MKKLSKFFAFLLSFAMLISLLPLSTITASAAEVKSANVAKIGDTPYTTLQAAINAVADGETITLLKDCSNAATFTANGRNIIIDGGATAKTALAEAYRGARINDDGYTYTGTLTVKGEGSITFKNMNVAPANTGSKTGAVVLGSTTAPDVTFVDCILKGKNGAGNIVYSASLAVNNTVTFKYCNMTSLSKLVMDNQTGPKKIILENVTATNMVYLLRSLKCPSITLKNVTCSAVIAIEVNNAGYGHLTLENVNLDSTEYSGSYFAPIQDYNSSGVGYDITVKGECVFTYGGVAYKGNEWFNGDANYNITIEKPAYVAQIGTQGYKTLADAIAAAQAGDIITFLADIEENVTINKALTIDGANFKYTGVMTFNEGKGGTIENVNFVKGKINIDNLNVAGDYTVKNCSFDGQKAIDHAIEAARTTSLTIEGCSVKNSQYSFLYVRLNIAKVIVKDVDVENVTYAVRVKYGNNATIENLTVKNAMGGLLADAEIDYVLRDCVFDGVRLPLTNYDDMGAAHGRIIFEGENTIPTMSNGGTFILAAGATLTAPENIAITTVDGYEVVYENGTHISKVAKLPSGYVAYRADVTDKADREGIAILLKDVYAKTSLVVKVYHNDTLMFTSARRDIDDEGKVMFPVNANTTANIVLWGKESGSWINEISVKPNELNVPNKIEVWADGVLVSTYTHESGTVLGVNLDKYLALDCVEKFAAKIGETGYATFAAALTAAEEGDTITLLADLSSSAIITIDKAITLDGNGHKLTSTAGRAINVSGANGVTIKNLTINCTGERAINIIQKATNVTIENVTATADNYTVNVAASAPNAVVAIKNSTLNGLCTVNVSAAGANVTVDNSTVNCNDNNTNVGESYAALSLNRDAKGGSIVATNTTVNVTAGSDSYKSRNGADNGTVTINGSTEDVVVMVAAITYAGSDNYHAFASLESAIEFAKAGDTITLIRDITISEGIINTKKITLDLNGKTITGTDNATGSFAIITNKGELTITGNGKMTLTATNNRGWNAYSSVISNTVGGKLIVENGTVEHLGGTDMAYGIDNLTNGKGTYAETIINGGTIKSTYRAIRMFLNGTEAQNILTVNGGVIEGTNKSIWMQDPSKNANTGKLTVTEGATLNGDVYLTATEGSTEWPVEVSIAASAVNGEVLTNANVPECYVLENKNGTWEVNKYAVVIGGQYYFETLADAVANAQNRNVLKLLCDCEGPGIVIDKNITIDFNGYTYTFTEDAVGSSNTKTNGFQIMKDNTVEFKNGTLKVADEAASKYAMLIQNYANLKIRNMTLDGTNLDYSSKVSYVVSINSGRVYFIGNVVVTSNDRKLAGDVGIDVYDYSAAGYDVPMVDIPETVKVDEYATIADAAKAGKVLAAARASKVFYASIQQAIENSASFSLVQDYVGPGFVIDKQVNINLGGFTLTINEGVGSAKTKTNGIQILKGAKVGLSNGKIEAADNGKLAILVQNYGDVQITNVELDGTNLDYSSKVSFTLSINSGNVKLMGTTNVIANDRDGADDIAIDVYDYSAAGYERPIVSIYSTVKYTEGKLLAAAKYGNYHYSSLQQCIDKHGTATLVCDFAGPGVVINKNATINFAGFTYTITEPVGSTGTASNGFQVLAGNRLTMNNGTLKVADSAANKFYILVQNYADLTLNSMTLDGTNLDKWSKTDGDSYTLSNNSGNVMINGTSKIIANNDGDKAFAFDVCDKSAWGYELPKVKVAATATIEGNIEAAAKIGVNYYATLAQAIADRDNASSKDEIVLMGNIVLEDTLTINATKAIVLDLNGFTISQTKACTGHYAMIVNKAILTIKDSVGGGKISFTDTGAGDPNFTWGSYTIVNENKLYVNGGTIENLSAQNANGSVKHMYCAIQQNNTKAQLQINGGTISTPSYRSIRINAGSLTFGAWATTEEGATIEGQVWIQPFADGIKVNVNNGKFSPAGVDSSSIYVDNSSKTVAFRINGGAFETKIGCSNADALKGAIRGGSFTEAAIEKTNATLFHKNFVNA